MLSTDERREFEGLGVVTLRGAMARADVLGLRQRLLEHLTRVGALPKSPPPGFVLRPAQSRSFMRPLDFESTWGPRVLGAIDTVLGAGQWVVPKQGGQLLAMSHPDRGATWELPHKVWHLDYPAPAALDALPGVQVFLCLDHVGANAGATLCALGSHRLIDRLRKRQASDWPGASLQVRKALARECHWLRELFSLRAGEDRAARFMTEVSRSGDVALQVRELLGEPGDVHVMHPWILHAPSPNCGIRPRMVVTERVHYKHVQRGGR